MEWLDSAIIPGDYWNGFTSCSNSPFLLKHMQPVQACAIPQPFDYFQAAVILPKLEPVNTSRHKWSAAEDSQLIQLVKTHGQDWLKFMNYFPSKTPSCLRKRWVNKLDPKIKKLRWTAEEDELITKMYQEHGGNWKLMSQSLEGRPATVIKNHFYGAIKRKIMAVKVAESKGITKLAEDSIVSSFFACSDECEEAFDLMQLKLPNIEKENMTSEVKDERLKQLYRRMSSIEAILKKAQLQIRKLDEQINYKLNCDYQ